MLRRTSAEIPMQAGPRHLAWDEFLALGEGQDDGYEVMEANEPAYILPTSGTTAKPKLAVHTHGGYQVHTWSMANWIFGLKPNDVWWSTSDIGWIVGHGYIVHAPLLYGCTTIAYEGAPDHPGPETFYRIIQENKVSGMFTSPTLVRLLMRYGADVARGFDLSSAGARVLRRRGAERARLGMAAEGGLQRRGAGHRPHVGDGDGRPDNRQSLRARPPADQARLRRHPAARHRGRDHDAGGRSPARPNEKGLFVIKRPFPGLTSTLWGEPERYGPDYWERIANANVYSHRRRRLDRRGRLRLVQRPRRRGDQDRRPPHRHDRGRDRLPAAPGRRRGRRHRPPGRAPGRGDSGLRGAEAGAGAVGAAAARSSSRRCGRSSARWRSSAT